MHCLILILTSLSPVEKVMFVTTGYPYIPMHRPRVYMHDVYVFSTLKYMVIDCSRVSPYFKYCDNPAGMLASR